MHFRELVSPLDFLRLCFHPVPVTTLELGGWWKLSGCWGWLTILRGKTKTCHSRRYFCGRLCGGHGVAGQRYVLVYSAWLLATTVRCSHADKPPPLCTLPSGSQFTGCNLVEKMWSLLVFGTDRLFFVRCCRASRMLSAGKEQGTDDSLRTGERETQNAGGGYRWIEHTGWKELICTHGSFLQSSDQWLIIKEIQLSIQME